MNNYSDVYSYKYYPLKYIIRCIFTKHPSLLRTLYTKKINPFNVNSKRIYMSYKRDYIAKIIRNDCKSKNHAIFTKSLLTGDNQDAVVCFAKLGRNNKKYFTYYIFKSSEYRRIPTKVSSCAPNIIQKFKDINITKRHTSILINGNYAKSLQLYLEDRPWQKYSNRMKKSAKRDINKSVKYAKNKKFDKAINKLKIARKHYVYSKFKLLFLTKNKFSFPRIKFSHNKIISKSQYKRLTDDAKVNAMNKINTDYPSTKWNILKHNSVIQQEIKRLTQAIINKKKESLKANYKRFKRSKYRKINNNWEIGICFNYLRFVNKIFMNEYIKIYKQIKLDQSVLHEQLTTLKDLYDASKFINKSNNAPCLEITPIAINSTLNKTCVKREQIIPYELVHLPFSLMVSNISIKYLNFRKDKMDKYRVLDRVHNSKWGKRIPIIMNNYMYSMYLLQIRNYYFICDQRIYLSKIVNRMKNGFDKDRLIRLINYYPLTNGNNKKDLY